jgi:hypothetical protein
VSALAAWSALVDEVNGRTSLGQPGVRDPEGICEAFDGLGYDGSGTCKSDGHYMCAECSLLSPEASRFTERDGGRRDRLRLFWARPGAAARQP